MAKITIGPGIGLLIAKIIGLFKHKPHPQQKVRFSINGRQVFCDGKPFRLIADTAWLMVENIGGTPSEVAFYLDQRKAQGFNTIMIGCNGSWFDGSVQRPIMAFFNQLDGILKQIADRGMFVVLSPQIHEYQNGVPVLKLPASEAFELGKFWGMRYRNYSALVFWMVGGLDDKGVVSKEVIMRQAEGIRSASNQLITFHPRAKATTLEAFGTGPCHQLALYQSYHDFAAASHEAAYAEMHASGVPYCNIEGPFEGEPTIGRREIEWVTAMAKEHPVFGFAYGNHYVWQFIPGWKSQLSSPGTNVFLSLTV